MGKPQMRCSPTGCIQRTSMFCMIEGQRRHLTVSSPQEWQVACAGSHQCLVKTPQLDSLFTACLCTALAGCLPSMRLVASSRVCVLHNETLKYYQSTCKVHVKSTEFHFSELLQALLTQAESKDGGFPHAQSRLGRSGVRANAQRHLRH